jgi:hypothetical protein
MTISFPNCSRHFDKFSGRIRFSGYDGLSEIRFLLDVDALAIAYPGMVSTEKDCLSAFDAARKRILAVSKRKYQQHGGQTVCSLTAGDFG